MDNIENTHWGAYLEGLRAIKHKVDTGIELINPHENNSKKWKSWNRGFNSFTPIKYDDTCQSCGSNRRNCIC